MMIGETLLVGYLESVENQIDQNLFPYLIPSVT